MPATDHSIEIDATPEAVMGVITDFRSYPGFLPETESVEVLREEPGSWEVRFTIRIIRRLSYTLRLVQRDPYNLGWSLVEGTFKANDGGWSLEPLDGGRRTRATYRIDVQVGTFVPGNIVRSLTDRSLPETLRRFKQEAERRVAAR